MAETMQVSLEHAEVCVLDILAFAKILESLFGAEAVLVSETAIMMRCGPVLGPHGFIEIKLSGGDPQVPVSEGHEGVRALAFAVGDTDEFLARAREFGITLEDIRDLGWNDDGVRAVRFTLRGVRMHTVERRRPLHSLSVVKLPD